MKIILEKTALIAGILYSAGQTVEVESMADVDQGYQALNAISLKEFTLDKPAMIGGDLHQEGDEVQVADIEIISKGYKDYEKMITRLKISESAGDTLSLLGTASDAVQLLIIMQCIHVTALANSTTFAGYKDSYKVELDKVTESIDSLPAIAAHCADLLSQIAIKAVVFPYSIKYATDKVAAVFADVARRATAISHELLKGI